MMARGPILWVIPGLLATPTAFPGGASVPIVAYSSALNPIPIASEIDDLFINDRSGEVLGRGHNCTEGSIVHP